MQSAADLMRELSIDPAIGLDEAAVVASRQRFGANTLQSPPREPVWRKFLAKFDEPIIKILLAAALLKFVVDLFDSAHGGNTSLGLGTLASVAVFFSIGLWAPRLRPWLPAMSFLVAGVLAVVGVVATGVVPAEGLAVMVAVALATGVGFYSEYKSDREFEVLNARTTERNIKVMRSGTVRAVPLQDVVVGDVLLIEPGDELPADGRVLMATDLHIDQSLLTGESEPALKTPSATNEDGSEYSGCVYRGTQVAQGVGRVLVCAVGDATQLGLLARSLTDVVDEPGQRVRRRLNALRELTPLQLKLQYLAGLISKVGYIAAAAVFVAFVAADIFRGRIAWPFFDGAFHPEVLRVGLGELLQAFVVMVVIIVVAVPEGLPMSVTVSLALAMRKMTRANSLVRQMVACETIGSATVICSDKTGTLTQNRMQVVGIGQVGASFDRSDNLIPRLPPVRPVDWIGYISAVNSTAHLEQQKGQLIPLGNPTEGALLLWLRKAGVDFDQLRATTVTHSQIHFTSERKRMTTTVELDRQEYMLIKGAPEWLLANATHYLDEEGNERPWDATAKQSVERMIADAAARAHRTLAFGYSRSAQTERIVYVGHVAIQDPLRPEVPAAIAECRSAGIAVIMITGDNPETARAIAIETRLLDDDSVLLTSEQFNELTDDDVTALLSRLKVLARAKPLDKLRLVNLLQAQNHVVAMTGDGTNDAPALKRADVGLAMGLSGTEVAKEASKIVLLDDSFATIVRAVHWGRALYENIQRFLQFQLTINVSALAIAFFGTLIAGTQPPFTVLQMLWINVIMDTFAAIALCSEPPRPGLLRMPPKRRDENILTRPMIATIAATASFYIVVMLGLLFGMKQWKWFGGDEPSALEPFTYRQATIFFTAYVLFQVWNQINCRSLTPEVSGLRGLFKNPVFLAVTAVTVVVQVLIVTFGGAVFNVRPLTAIEWLAIAGSTASVLIFAEIVRHLRRSRAAR